MMYRVSHTHDIIGVLAGLLTFSVWAFFWTFDPRDLVGLGRGPAVLTTEINCGDCCPEDWVDLQIFTMTSAFVMRSVRN